MGYKPLIESKWQVCEDSWRGNYVAPVPMYFQVTFRNGATVYMTFTMYNGNYGNADWFKGSVNLCPNQSTEVCFLQRKWLCSTGRKQTTCQCSDLFVWNRAIIENKSNIMKILTWNINGIRTRPSIKEDIESLDADIICFQETKVTSELNLHLIVSYSSYQDLYMR